MVRLNIELKWNMIQYAEYFFYRGLEIWLFMEKGARGLLTCKIDPFQKVESKLWENK